MHPSPARSRVKRIAFRLLLSFGLGVVAALILLPALFKALDDADPTGKKQAEAWTTLVSQNYFEEAGALCRGWLESDHAPVRAEGHKCLANVEMQASTRQACARPPQGEGPTSRECLSPESTRSILDHLEKALHESPGDAGVLEGRPLVYILSDRLEEAPTVLRETLQHYHPDKALAVWLEYGRQLEMLGYPETAVAFRQVILEAYPQAHEAESDLGTLQARLSQDQDAEQHLLRAHTLAPTNTTYRLNLARFYAYTHRQKEALTLLETGLEQGGDEQARGELRCEHGRLLVEAGDKEKGCGEVKGACPPEERSGCP